MVKTAWILPGQSLYVADVGKKQEALEEVSSNPANEFTYGRGDWPIAMVTERVNCQSRNEKDIMLSQAAKYLRLILDMSTSILLK